MSELPTGTVTFLFSDLEVSTRLWEQHHDAMVEGRARYFTIVDEAVTRAGGVVFSHAGDAVDAAFTSAPDALRAAVDAQREMGIEPWGETGPLAARMALHTGEGVVVGEDQYDSQPLNRCARLMGVANGGQLLVSGATAALVSDALVDGVELADLGEHRLRDLARPMRVYQVHARGLRSEFPPLASVDAFRSNLPLQMSSFIGREAEMAQTIAALRDARVVTLTGVGGVGKTRLALQVAAEAMPDFREGAWLVELAPVRDPDGVIDAFAAVFGVTARAGQTLVEALVAFLETKQLLLVVDNCEHLLDPVADLVEVIGRSCPGVVVLATSREGLAVLGERILAVPSLGSPSDAADFDAVLGSDAVQLFVERANAADAAFAVGSDNAASVVRVCRRLDGVPLAIELAAARVTMMSLVELAGALDRRFEVLAGGRRGGIERQQTLRATIDWSYDLLDEPQRRLLDRLSVFAGGCTRAAAEAICAGEPVAAGSVFELLGDLVARYLVVADRGGPETRYRLSETIRAYGEERLAEHQETMPLRDRHARYYIELGGTITDGLLGPDQVQWANRLEAEQDNYLTAMNHALDTQNVDLAMDLRDCLPLAAGQVGYALRLPAYPVLALPDAHDHPAYPTVLMIAALQAANRGELDLAQQRSREALDAQRRLGARARPGRVPLDAQAIMVRGQIATATGAFLDASDVYRESAELLRRGGVGDGSAAFMLAGAANMLNMAGQRDTAIPVATEALALARAAGAPTTIGISLNALAHALSDTAPDRARALLDEALALNTTLGYESWVELTVMTLAAARLADWPLTARVAGRAIRHLHWINSGPVLAGILNVAARVVVDTDPQAAARIQGAARTLALAVTTTPSPTTPNPTNLEGADTRTGQILEVRRDTTRRLADTLGDDRLRQLRDQGALMDTDQAVAYTLSRLDAFLTNTDN